MIALFVLAIFSAPLYVWRFNLVGQPINALMLVLGAVIFVGLINIFYRGWWQEFISSVKSLPKVWCWLINFFALASIISLFVGGVDGPKLAQWLVLYVQPILIFLLLRFYSEKYPSLRGSLTLAIYVMLGIAGAVALAQYFTLRALPTDYWGNANEPKRAIAFFAHPNAFGLFVTPLLAWLMSDVAQRIKLFWQKKSISDAVIILLWLLGALGMFLSLSRGAWFGFAAAAALFAVLSANKKIILSLVAVGTLVAGFVAVTPNLRYRLLLPFHGEKSAVARLSLWNTAGSMIKDNPILGKGIHGFNYNWEKYNQDPNLEHYNFPHNIFLNFWVDLGLLGMLSMIGVIAYSLWQGIKHRKNQYRLAWALFIVAMLVHGLIDIPYLKNDLALVFWMILALSS